MTAPLYLFTGFLDSGKTTLIKDTLSDPSFMAEQARTLLLCFEEGEESYSKEFLEERNTFIEYFDTINDLTAERANELDIIYHPNQVFIEYNGSEVIDQEIFRNLHDIWPVVEILSTVDATTFPLFIANMRGMIFEQLRYSDVVIVNRCTDDTDAMMIRGNIKAINRMAQIYYEKEFGEPAVIQNNLLPFDINADVIDLKDDDYGLWYMDAMEDPSRYDEKRMIIRGQFQSPIPGYKQSFIMGRRAMVCCENDTSLCSFTVTGVKVEELKKDDWVEVEGVMKLIPIEGGGHTIVLYADRIQFYPPLKDPFVYFN